ncbi:hypothetical protein MNBD_PLANCTO02-3239 [hydrothermal vent metagenome]|uniref:Uncharacterized protein n=1 Tax=hydrothermal vent metagenome TaxID=652676 RepID=A0A3B1E447_9ZZZZ
MKLLERVTSLSSQDKNGSKTKWRMVGMTALALPLLLWAFSFAVLPAVGDDTSNRGGTGGERPARRDRDIDGTREHRHEGGREQHGKREGGEGGTRPRFGRGKRNPQGGEREMLELMRDLHREIKMLRREVKELRDDINEMNGGKKNHRDRSPRRRDFDRRGRTEKPGFKRPFREKKDPHQHSDPREGGVIEPR